MAERAAAAPNDAASIREAVCINTAKIFDSCRDKDCIDDIRVFPTVTSQSYIENAVSIRPRTAELLYILVNVAPVSFNRGYYTVDCTYFYRITGETFPAGQICTGLSVFDKRVMLFGSEASVKTFSSEGPLPLSYADELPTAVVSSVDPVCLRCKLVDSTCLLPTELEQRDLPRAITAAFDEALILTDTARRWFATIGQFSIVRLQRDTQLLIPAYDYCMPEKECPDSGEDDPCSLFSRIRFPVEEFFPPDSISACDEYRQLL